MEATPSSRATASSARDAYEGPAHVCDGRAMEGNIMEVLKNLGQGRVTILRAWYRSLTLR